MNDEKAQATETPDSAASELSAGLGCICCANGNDLPEGEWCRACGFGLPVREDTNDELSPLAKAVKAARGGDAPIPKRWYA